MLDPTSARSPRGDLSARESQLWRLAMVIMLLLTVALLVVDSSHGSKDGWVCLGQGFVLDTQAMRAILVVAMLVICAYFVDTTRRLRAMNDRLVRSLSENGDLLRKRHRDACKLRDLSDTLIGVTELGEALQLLVDTAAVVTDADTASVMLLDKGDDCLRIVASHGLAPEVVNSAKAKLGDSLAGLVAKSGEGLLIDSSELSEDLLRLASRTGDIATSAIAPIHIGEESIGVVCVAKRRDGDPLIDWDLGVISTLANQASLVIQKIRLLDDLRRQIGRLESALDDLGRAQVRLMQSEKLNSIGQLAGGVAHEINNPLQVIMGRAEMLMCGETDPAKRANLDAILSHTVRIADIVANLLSFSRQSSDMGVREIDLNSVVVKTLGLLETQALAYNVAIERDLEEVACPVLGSSGQLQQVFTNIGINALQAMRTDGGVLTVRCRADGSMVMVDIADTGPGIPSEAMDRLFEPFYTTKPEGEGTGLGLSIAYGIVEAHGGCISVQSAPGRGACFRVSLPQGSV